MFIETTSEADATGATAELYDDIRAGMGHVPNFIRIFSHGPDILDAWEAHLTLIRDRLSPRRYEIATIGAASALRSSYCMLAHGTKLLNLGMSSDDLAALARGSSGGEEISDLEHKIFAYAHKIARDATSVTASDVEELRAEGLSDTEIFDIAATACVRCFISKMADAMGAQPDSHYLTLDAGLRDALVLGRPIETD